MLENVYDTIFSLINVGLPKDVNNSNLCVVYDKPILGWYIGDPTPQAAKPNISIQGVSSKPKKVGQGSWEYEHTLTIKIAIAQSTTETSERNVQEFARVIRNVLLPHRRIWVCMQCPFDRLQIYSPEHYLDVHESIISSYITSAQTKFINTWDETHDSGTNPAPIDSIPNSGIATEAFNELIADVTNNVTVSSIPSTAPIPNSSNKTYSPLADIQFAIANNWQYIRLLYNVEFSDIKASNDDQDQALRKSGEFTITANEIIKQSAYGPDGASVPTTGYQRNIIS